MLPGVSPVDTPSKYVGTPATTVARIPPAGRVMRGDSAPIQ